MQAKQIPLFNVAFAKMITHFTQEKESIIKVVGSPLKFLFSMRKIR